jgi:hypothetical protein
LRAGPNGLLEFLFRIVRGAELLFPDGLIIGFPDAGPHDVALRGSPGLRRLRTSSMLLITLLTAL